MKLPIYGLLCTLLLLTLSQCKRDSFMVPASTIPTRDDNLAISNPSGTRSVETSPDAYLITRSTYNLFYNQSNGMTDIGLPVRRGNNFPGFELST